MASEVERPPSTVNTSGESMGSGGHKSMLELLSITDAAVKALNKSTRSLTSTSSHASVKSDQSSHSNNSVHSGISHRSDRSLQSHHTDQSVQSHHTDRSVKSHHSGQSVKSQQSDRLSVQSKKSDHSVQSKHSVVSGHSSGGDQLKLSQHSQASAKSTSSHSNKSGQSHHSGHSGKSHQSERSTGQPLTAFEQDNQTVHNISNDSGVISKTHTLSEDKSKKPAIIHGPSPVMVHDSDESTTASDVLIRSTLGDRSERSILAMNSSITSKCSKTSYGAENFNSYGPQKVKVAKKYLKEIKSPFDDDDDSPRDSGSGSGSSKVPSSLLSGSDKESSGGGSDRDSKKSSAFKISSGRNVGVPRGLPREPGKLTQFGIEKVKKTETYRLQNVNMEERKLPQVKVVKEPQVAINKVSATETNTKHQTKPPPNPVAPLKSTPKYFVERHSPQKHENIATSVQPPASTVYPERKNLLQELEDSVEDLPQRKVDSSSSSSQPEVITVPERIVTISARNSVSPSSTITDLDSRPACPPTQYSNITSPIVVKHVTSTIQQGLGFFTEEQKLQTTSQSDDIDSDLDLMKSSQGKGQSMSSGDIPLSSQDSLLDLSSNSIPPALKPHTASDDKDGQKTVLGGNGKIPARFELLSKVNKAGLRQGAPVSGSDNLGPEKETDDVQISQFRLTEKQKLMKESLMKRTKDHGPVRRVVQPRIVGHEARGSSASSTDEERGKAPVNQSNEVLTAAAAASAAVAATQPFLKAQYEMETRMKEILEKVSDLQRKDVEKTVPVTDADRVKDLETQLSLLTEKRIDYIEKLQQQQIAMQANFMSMSREPPTGRTYTSQSMSREPPTGRTYTSQSPAQSPESRYRKGLSSSPQCNRRAFNKTTVHSARDGYPSKGQKYQASDIEDSVSALDTPAPRSRAPKPTIYDTSDMELRPKARSRSRSPAKDDRNRGILHQILATDTQDNSYRQRMLSTEKSPSVSKAKHLVEELASLKEQMKGIVSNAEQLKKNTSLTSVSHVQGTHSHLSDSATSGPVGPSPLDPYLVLHETDAANNYKSVPNLSFTQINAPVPPGFKEAESVLRQVQQNRHYLEANLEAVLRTKQEAEVYTLLEALHQDSSNKDVYKIQQKVADKISRLQKEVEREVTDDIVLEELKRQHPSKVPGAVKVPAPAPTKPAGRGWGRRGLTEPKVDVGVKSTVRKPGVTFREPSKENITQKSRPKPKKGKSVFENEEYMTKIYGKASYQKGRTTVKDPYIHMQNIAKQKPSRPPGVVETKGVELMSSKTQTKHSSVKQFYFNPASGSYIPVASSTAAPIPGQLIPMAVPLGGPRMNPGMTIPVAQTGHLHTQPVNIGQIPAVTASSNVTMVSIPTEEDKKQKPSPELAKQVLPPVDIDTDLSEMDDVRPQSKRVQIKTPERSPNKSHFEVTYHDEATSRDPGREEEEEEEDVLTISGHSQTVSGINRVPVLVHESDDSYAETDADEKTATGLVFPGYQPSEAAWSQEYHGPQFPPPQPSTDRQLTSDLIAEDIKRRDVLQNKVTDWVEQELMARIITEVYPLPRGQEPADLSHVVSEGSEDSIAEDREQSGFVMDNIGRRGLQLFIDAGQAVDNNMVSELVREVLQDKIRGMLGQRPDQEETTPLIPGTSGTVLHEEIEEALQPLAEPHRHVSTPEPTPRASPTSSPPRHVTEAYTPDLTPRAESPTQEETRRIATMTAPEPMSEQESEPESSASLDIREELRKLAGQIQYAPQSSIESRHDVRTPPTSPSPDPPQREVYIPDSPPEPSPRPLPPQPQPVVTPAPVVMEKPILILEERGTSPISPPTPPEVEEEVEEEQPHPVMISMAAADRQQVVEERRKSRSPSPARKSHSQTPSESSYSESSSISDTFNENVSEGQWLISKSEGEVADFPIDDVALRQRMLRSSQRKVDVSSASTWKDIDDVDLEETTDKSEGEFLYKTPVTPENDPVLDLLSRLHSSTPQYGQYPMSTHQVTNVLNTSGKSTGEITPFGASGRSEGEILIRERTGGVTRQPAGPIHVQSQPRVASPDRRPISPTRVSFEDQQRPSSPQRGILKQKNGRRSDINEPPVRDRQSPGLSGSGRLTPGGRQPQGRGPTVSAGGRTSPGKGMRRPPQVIKSSTLPSSYGSSTRLVQVRSSSDDFKDSLENTGGMSYYSSDMGTRNMTPDQMNLDPLIQSGYLSQSFSQSENGRFSTGGSSARSGRSYGQGRSSDKGRSLGYSYESGGSMSEAELRRLAESGTLKMSVTLPGTEAFEQDSDLSEIDITEGGNTMSR